MPAEFLHRARLCALVSGRGRPVGPMVRIGAASPLFPEHVDAAVLPAVWAQEGGI